MLAPHNISNYRRELCQRCKTPCEHQNDAAFRVEGDNACPIGSWQAYKTFIKVQWKGAGDAVAAVAQPVAGAIDRVARAFGKKTNVKGCSSCRKRKEMLNHLIPWGQKKV